MNNILPFLGENDKLAESNEVELSFADENRLRELVLSIANQVIKRAIEYELSSNANYKKHRNLIEDLYVSTCASAIKQHVAQITKAAKEKFSIRDVRERAKSLKERTMKELAKHKAELVKFETMAEKRFAADTLRKVHAEQIISARKKIRELRQLVNEEKTKLDRLYMDINSVLYKPLSEVTPGNTATGNNSMYGVHTVTYASVPDPDPILIPNDTAEGIPHMSGIYFLWKDGIVDYVGQSIRLNGRLILGSHHVLQKDHQISFVFCEPINLDWAECYYIGICKPDKNFGAKRSKYRDEPRIYPADNMEIQS